MGRFVKKFLPIVILSLVLVIFTVTAYIIRENKTKNNNLLVVTEIVNPNENNLIPKNAVQGVNDVTEVLFNYNIRMSNPEMGIDNLYIKCTNIKIGDSEEYSRLVNIEVQKAPYALKNEILVVVRVSLNEPENYATYEAIKNQIISFDIIFSSIEAIEL